jgi:4-amino-4-deoxy-L-arabinose transferase-like glycosyltransferase
MKSKSKILLITILLVASFLRLWKLAEVPVSLFGDELDVGYHAYSILKTGKDYSGNSMPLHFQSLAEWRTPLYLYSVVPTVAIYGISPLGVRLPAALFGILGVWGLYLLVKQLTKNERLAFLSAFVLTISPWHIQYSRAAFEVTMLLAFLLFGLYFFFKSLSIGEEGPKDGRWLWAASALLVTTPLIYSTAKLFTPAILLVLLILWKKEIFKLPKETLTKALLTLAVLGGITAYATLFSGGGQRFGYIGVFSDPTIPTEVGTARLRDVRMRGETGYGLSPNVFDRFFHNKVTFWSENISRNILQPFSTDFLFIKGDLNLRHSIDGVGQFYRIEFITMVLGLLFFFSRYKDKRVKAFIALWLVLGVLPAAITRDGGKHATRLILILPPLVFLISYGLIETAKLLKGNIGKFFLLGYFGLLMLAFTAYQHEYWVHNPWDSERWWHSGFEESISTIKEIDKDYDKVILSMANEPVWIFFAGWYEYPPAEWHKGFPFEESYLDGFGGLSYIDKYYFAGVREEDGGIFALPQYIDDKTLYLAVASEIGENLIMDPGKGPAGLRLIKAIPYPSGEPAFYLFAKE